MRKTVVVCVMVVALAAGVAAILAVGNAPQDVEWGEKTEPTVLEYSMALADCSEMWELDVRFVAPIYGHVSVTLDGEPLLDGLGQPIERWFGEHDRVTVAYMLWYPEGMTFDDVKDGLELEFSSWIQPVCVS